MTRDISLCQATRALHRAGRPAPLWTGATGGGASSCTVAKGSCLKLLHQSHTRAATQQRCCQDRSLTDWDEGRQDARKSAAMAGRGRGLRRRRAMVGSGAHAASTALASMRASSFRRMTFGTPAPGHGSSAIGPPAMLSGRHITTRPWQSHCCG